MKKQIVRGTCLAGMVALLFVQTSYSEPGNSGRSDQEATGSTNGTQGGQTAPANGALSDKPRLSTQPPIGQRYVYKVVEGKELHLWVMEPPDENKQVRHPAIVFYHGGGFVGGGSNQFNYESQHFASRGMVAVQVEYRLLPESDRTILPTICIEDAKSAMRWVKAHAEELGIDTDHIAAAGGSAGGYLAAFMGTIQQIDAQGDDLRISTKPNAIVLFNGVIDNGPTGWAYQRFGDKYKALSPAYNVSSSTPPTLSMSGSKDTLITPASIQAFQAAMKQAGVRCDVIMYPDQEHGFFNFQPFAERTTLATDSFLVSLGWLKAPPTVGPLQ